ncbi:MAG TPA: hypothetical protein VFF84_01985 [Sphingobium sp.]|nr:hypothetical protein [Sphingobium sp.]
MPTIIDSVGTATLRQHRSPAMPGESTLDGDAIWEKPCQRLSPRQPSIRTIFLEIALVRTLVGAIGAQAPPRINGGRQWGDIVVRN